MIIINKSGDAPARGEFCDTFSIRMYTLHRRVPIAHRARCPCAALNLRQLLTVTRGGPPPVPMPCGPPGVGFRPTLHAAGRPDLVELEVPPDLARRPDPWA